MRDHEELNQLAWNQTAPKYVANAERSWALAPGEEDWGIWNVPESEVRLLPDDLDGQDVVELGCGTAYVSAWIARRGGRPTGVDLSDGQLATAKRMQQEHGLEFPLIHASAEDVPLPDHSADFVISEYGACLWCDPERWLAEASRLLRPGGRLHFLTNAWQLILCSPPTGAALAELQIDQFDTASRFEWPVAGDDKPAVEFHLAHGDWIDVLGRHGFAVDRLYELRAPAGGDAGMYDFVTLDWARRWPSEEVWFAHKR